MLSKKMEKALNGQVNAELYSSYLYLSMASYFGSLDLEGFVNWMKVQALEELYHAMKIIEDKDHATNNFLQWFVAEQVEEEDSANSVLQKLKLVDDKSGLFLLDRELAARVMTIPPDLKITVTAAAGGA